MFLWVNIKFSNWIKNQYVLISRYKFFQLNQRINMTPKTIIIQIASWEDILFRSTMLFSFYGLQQPRSIAVIQPQKTYTNYKKFLFFKWVLSKHCDVKKGSRKELEIWIFVFPSGHYHANHHCLYLTTFELDLLVFSERSPNTNGWYMFTCMIKSCRDEHHSKWGQWLAKSTSLASLRGPHHSILL